MKALVIKDLKKTYKNGLEAVKGIDLSVEKGDFFALLGPNGAGKSTIIGIVTSLVNKTSGSVKVFEKDLDKQNNLVKEFIGLVPQEFNFNIFEKVIDIVVNQGGYYGLPRELALKRAKYYLKELGLWEKKDEVSRNLSGGMKRKLMIVRALVHNPKLLILDEPTAGVDVETRRSMWKFLNILNKKGTTIILTTHYLEEAEQLCKNIAIIKKGKIIEDTSMKNLLKKVDKEIFVLDLSKPIKNPKEIENHKVKILNPTTLEVSISKEENINDMIESFSRKGIKISSMRNKSNRLEELFISLIEEKRK